MADRADRAYLRMDQPFAGLIHQDPKDPPLDLSFEEDPLLDLMSGLMKASCGKHEEDPTLGCTSGEELLMEE